MLGKFKDKNNLTSFYYTIFEGLSKGGNQILLIIIASLISKDLYLQLMLLISLEAFVTMLYLSYNADVLYSFKKNRNLQSLACVIDTSLLQFVIFICIYFILRNPINSYFNYNLFYVFFFIAGNGFLGNLIRFYSVSFQIELKHRKALLFKSIPFFLSFLFSISFFFILNDKVLGFFMGKFIGLFIFFIFIFRYEKGYKLILTSNKFYFGMLFKRAKYSFIIALLGWGSGLGFLNFAKIYSQNTNDLLVLGLILNIFTILQLVANGINQVYVPNLKRYIAESIYKTIRYTKKIMLRYFTLTLLFSITVFLVLTWKDKLLIYMPDMLPVLQNRSILYLVVILFFISSFYWAFSPYFMIMDKYKEYFITKISCNIFAWIIIFLLLYVAKINYIIMYFFIIKILESGGISVYIVKTLRFNYKF